jgi:hypothetical protein
MMKFLINLCNFLQPPITSLLLGPDILLSSLFAGTLYFLYISVNARDRVSYQYKITGPLFDEVQRLKGTLTLQPGHI